jgi:tetratricopeptide (TPR) repeat protein
MYAAMRGDYAEALAAGNEARQIAQAINNLWNQAYSLTGLGMAHWYRGEYAQAEAVARECLRLASPSGFMAAHALVGSELAAMLLDFGQPEAALAQGQTALHFALQHLPPLAAQCVGVTALAQMALGQLDAAEATLTNAPLTTVDDMRWMASQVWRAHTELARLRRAPTALSLAEQQIALMVNYNVAPLIAEAQLTLAQVLRQRGQLAEAHTQLLAALELAQGRTLRRLLWPILAELAGVAVELGEASVAANWRAEARSVIDHIAAGLSDAATRTAFERFAAGVLAERGSALLPEPKAKATRRKPPAKRATQSTAKARSPKRAATKPAKRKAAPRKTAKKAATKSKPAAKKSTTQKRSNARATKRK